MKFISCIFASALILSSVECAHPENIPANLVKISTPTYQPRLSDFEPKVGTYTYDVSWQGIPAATVKVKFEKEGYNYLAKIESWTAKAIDIFYRLRFRAEGVLSTLDLSPVRMVIDHQENSRHKITQLSFLPTDEIISVHTRVGKGTDVLKFNPNNFTLDPFSGAFIARALDWTENEVKKFDIYNGKTRYLIELAAKDRRTIRFNGADRHVWVISPKVFNLTNPDKNKKFREAEIFLSDDKERDILKISSEVFIGSVSTTLDDFVPSAAPPVTNVALVPDTSAKARLK